MKCAITGVSGYLGRLLKEFFDKQGWEVLGLSHSGNALAQGRRVFFSLKSGIDGQALAGIDVLIHGAYDFSLRRWEDIFEVNVQGSIKLFQAAKMAGVRKIIYVSSMSSFANCQSLYGRAKLLIEDEARRIGAWIVRPGLIYGVNASGMMGALEKVIKKSPIVPLVGTGEQVLYLVHSEDLCRFFT